MFRMYIRQHETLGPWYQKFERQPGWVTKAAIVAAVLVVGIPLLMLTLAAILVGLAVFTVLGLLASGVATIRGLFGGGGRPMPPSGNDGRHNVRVIR
jgi:hypothetical protein